MCLKFSDLEVCANGLAVFSLPFLSLDCKHDTAQKVMTIVYTFYNISRKIVVSGRDMRVEKSQNKNDCTFWGIWL